MLAQVELRLSAKTDASWSSRLNVDINPDIDISLADVTGKYGGEPELFVPPSRGEPVTYYSYKQPWGQISFGMSPESGRLIEFILSGAQD